jgi:hypothetical protein
MQRNQKGFVEIFVLLGIVLLFVAMFTVRFSLSNSTASGIAYNVTNDRFISGATQFSLRAGENTPVTEENQSVYCLPPNSPYKALVNKAAADKRVKIQVDTSKYFAIKAPWVCQDNVKVTEVK